MRKLLLIALLSLAGCAVPQQRQAPPRYVSSEDPTQQCMDRLRTDVFLVQTLGPKTGFGSNTPPSLELRADKSTPSQEEKQALSMYAAARQQCKMVGESYRRSTVPPVIAAAMDAGWNGIDNLLAKLYAGDITFGQYNQMRVENGAQANDKIRSAAAVLDQAQAQADAQNAANRQMAAGMLMQSLQQQQALQQQQQQLQQQQLYQMQQNNRTINTNCQRFGNQVNCTSY